MQPAKTLSGLWDHCRSLVQPLLSSSYRGWGISSLDRDADEILVLAEFLKSDLNSKASFPLHNTQLALWWEFSGFFCQDPCRSAKCNKRHFAIFWTGLQQQSISQCPSIEQQHQHIWSNVFCKLFFLQASPLSLRVHNLAPHGKLQLVSGFHSQVWR